MAGVLITGSTGLIGVPLCQLLVENGYQVHSLSRSTRKHPVAGVKTFSWQPERGIIDEKSLEGVEAIVHLAGAGIADKPWTDQRKQEIIDSRTKSAETLAGAIKKGPYPIKTIVSASAIGYYGNRRKGVRNEDEPAGHTFPAEVCQAWEAAARTLAGDDKRLVIHRIGIVLARNGGAYPKLARPVKLGVGTWLGDGEQMMSWIHIRDMVNLLAYSLANPEMNGVYNAVAPEPVSQKFLIKQIGRYIHRIVWPFGVPSWAIMLAMGERSQLVLDGISVRSERLLETGFRFRYPHLYEALRELNKKK